MRQEIISNDTERTINSLHCGFQILQSNNKEQPNLYFGINRFTGNLFITANSGLNRETAFEYKFQIGVLSKCDSLDFLLKNLPNTSNTDFFLQQYNSLIKLSEWNRYIFSSISTVIIEVLDVNDNPPIFDETFETNFGHNQHIRSTKFQISEHLKQEFAIARFV